MPAIAVLAALLIALAGSAGRVASAPRLGRRKRQISQQGGRIQWRKAGWELDWAVGGHPVWSSVGRDRMAGRQTPTGGADTLVPEGSIEALVLEQPVVCSPLDYSTLLQHQNAVGALDRL